MVWSNSKKNTPEQNRKQEKMGQILLTGHISCSLEISNTLLKAGEDRCTALWREFNKRTESNMLISKASLLYSCKYFNLINQIAYIYKQI